MSELVPYTRRPPARPFTADWLLDPAELAQRIGGTDFVPTQLRNNPAAITAALLYGEALGLHPMIALAEIAVINGRPAVSAKQQRALILAAGHDIWIEESTVSRCTVCGRRRDSDQVSRVTWTLDDAKRAQLAGKPSWRLYPRQMLMARASAELARAIFPDAIGGLAAAEELEEEPARPADNGPEPPAKASKRRRVSVTTVDTAPPPAPEPVTSAPAATPSPQDAGTLPPDEQAWLDGLRQRFDAAEPEPGPAAPEAEPPADAATEPPATSAYKRQIFALMRDVGLQTDDRDQRLAYTIRVIGRPIDSSNDLTMSEARLVVDDLQALQALTPEERQQRLAAGAPPPASTIDEAQRDRLRALYFDKGLANDADRLAYAGGVLERKPGSLDELTADEASTVIAHLEQYDRDDHTTWPFPEGF